MVEIVGRFDVSLPTPVDVGLDLSGHGLSPCQFRVAEDRITISPLTITEAPVPDGEYESHKLTQIRVWISKEIDSAGTLAVLSPDEERVFEGVLVKATRRFITVVKHKTNQWDLDTRHPIGSYSYIYSRSDIRLGTSWPIGQGTKCPEYVGGMIVWQARDFQKELTRDIWQEVAVEVPLATSIPFHDELLHDAKAFRSYMRYDASALYAAIAAELMLEKACMSLLIAGRGLGDKQSKTRVSRLTKRELLDLVCELDPSLPLERETIRRLFKLRNDIAHGKAEAVTGGKAAKAISSAEQLKEALVGVL